MGISNVFSFVCACSFFFQKKVKHASRIGLCRYVKDHQGREKRPRLFPFPFSSETRPFFRWAQQKHTRPKKEKRIEARNKEKGRRTQAMPKKPNRPHSFLIFRGTSTMGLFVWTNHTEVALSFSFFS
nr:hypothetical protein [Pandoravirus massiliensis]